MRDLDSLSGKSLLSIAEPESLFSYSAAEAKREYRSLVGRWHPDLAAQPEAQYVFGHIVQLYKLAKTKLDGGNWIEPAEKIEEETPGIKKFRLADHSLKQIEYIAVHRFELGTMFIGNHQVTYQIGKDYYDLFTRGADQMNNLAFADESMAVEMAQYLPQITERFKAHNSHIISIRKTPDQLLLADVIAHYRHTPVAVEHVAWMINGLLNIACYLQCLGLTHNAISPDTVFVSPLRHTITLLGGWWYATECGATLRALPDRTMEAIPSDIIHSRCADFRSDLELIRLTGREVLGDASGLRLLCDKTLPDEISEWLTTSSAGSAIGDYKYWKGVVLRQVFGKPRFIEWDCDSELIYKEED